jgi:hypothetical protein
MVVVLLRLMVFFVVEANGVLNLSYQQAKLRFYVPTGRNVVPISQLYIAAVGTASHGFRTSKLSVHIDFHEIKSPSVILVT